MNRSPTRQFDPNVLAVLHKTGRVWRGLAARIPAGASGDGKPRLLAHREFSGAETARMGTWLDEQEAGRIIVILHASSVICRTCSLPDAPAPQLEPALRLQAEAHLLGIAPPHRIGMAVLEAAPGETSRSGIVLAWPEHRPGNGAPADAHRPPLTPEQLAGREIRYAADVASLASLLDGQRPTQPLAWVDREDGSLALAVSHASGAVFRGLREDAGDPSAWNASVTRVLAETGLSVGHTAAFIESLVAVMQERLSELGEGEARLIAPREVIGSARERLDDAPADEKWWSHYGVAAGIITAQVSELAPLTNLRETVPIRSTTPLDRAVTALSSRKAAVIAVAACLAVLMFGSFITNGARLAILKMKYPEERLDAQLADINAIRNQLVMYRELDRNAWSATKILSDIASNTPQGIELEFIRVTPQRSFTVKGRAIPTGGRAAPELVAQMRQNLNDSGIFRDSSLDWEAPDAFGNHQFTLSANLSRPYWRHRYPEELDFAGTPLAVRLYGERAMVERSRIEEPKAEEPRGEMEAVTGLLEEIFSGERDPAAGAMAGVYDDVEEMDAERLAALEEAGGIEPRGTRIRPNISGLTRDPSASRPEGREALGVEQRGDASSAGSPDFDIPPPLTSEQVEAMTDAEVRDMLPRIAQARRRARTRQDDELGERLRQEWDWLMERMRSPR